MEPVTLGICLGIIMGSAIFTHKPIEKKEEVAIVKEVSQEKRSIASDITPK